MPKVVRSLVVGLMVSLAGCYSLRPVSGPTIEPGMMIAFDLNDAGRAALGGTMGPEISRVEGRLIAKDDGEYTVGVSSVDYLRGGTQVWKGEQVRIKPDYVRTVYERRLSKVKTAAMGAGSVAVMAAILTRSVFGEGRPEDPSMPTPKDTTATTSRGVRP